MLIVSRSRHSFSGSVVSAIVALAVTAGPAKAASIIVTTKADVMAVDGLCSLREAIRSANNNNLLPAVPGECATGSALPAVDVISFAASGDYNLTIPGRGEDAANTGDLDITESLTIVGTSNPNAPVTINAHRIDRVFHVLPHAVATFTGPLRIRGGHAKEDGINAGGGILNWGTLVLDAVEISNNVASCGDEGSEPRCETFGGGIASAEDEAPSAPVTIQNSLVFVNQVYCASFRCRAFGGGIANGRTAMTVNDSQVLSNQAFCAAEQCNPNGGGIATKGSVTLAGYNEVVGNVADCAAHGCSSWGGGIYASGGTLEIQSSGFLTPLSLIDGNASQCRKYACAAGGGGILLSTGDGLPSLTMVAQVTNNTAACFSGTVSCQAAGGGIYNLNGPMFITSSSISTNMSLCANPDCGSVGGGIYNSAFVPALVGDSTLSHNDAKCTKDGCNAVGGGMYLAGTDAVSIERSTFESNRAWCTAPDAPSGGARKSQCFLSAGGLSVAHQTSALIHRSTFSGNSIVCAHENCFGDGGAITVAQNAAAVIENSTLSHNSATRGGAVTNFGAITVSFSTLADNSAAVGSGLYLLSPAVNTIRHSIFANSAPGANCAHDGNYILVAGGSNLSSDGSCTQFLVQNTDPKLGVLGNYGGLAKTRPLLIGSPAIDAASNCTDAFGDTVAIDQRGVARPDGAACDTGAYEGVLSVSFTSLSALLDRFGTQETSLRAVLREAAERLTDRNPANDAAGCGQLEAFVHQVGALEKREELTRDQSDELQLAALNLHASYGCTAR